VRKVTCAVFFAMLFLAQYCRAQTGACFYQGGPILDSYGCSTVVTSVGAAIFITAGISGVVATDFQAQGAVTGDFGTVTSGSASSPCQIFNSGAPGAPIEFEATAAPGVHQLGVKFTYCGPPSFLTGASWSGQVTILVLPPNPANPPPPLCGALLLDPVRSGLLQGPAVTSNEGSILNPNALTPPVQVRGVSADGVTQAIVAVATANLGDSVRVNLINDANNLSSSSAQDGGLTRIGGNVNSTSNGVSLVADSTTTIGPTAFAIYVAPTNYARGSQNFPQDNTSVQRSVSLQTYCQTSGGSPTNPTTTPVTLVRPPVVLVHGLWTDSKALTSTWTNFVPVGGSTEALLWSQLDQNPGEQVFWADYTAAVDVDATTPPSDLSQVSGSALGFQFNAPTVLNQIQLDITTYANDLDVAAVQADVVGHSMGGNIVRMMPIPNEPWNFFTNGTYGQGPIEKLITIGTPHLGSPLATDLLPTSSGQDPNRCVRNRLAGNGDVALQAAIVAGASVNGGVNDLVGDGQDTNGLSLALQSEQASQSTQPFPMAYLAGTENAANLANLSCSPLSGCTAGGLRFVCGTLGDPLANDLTSSSWPTIFGGGPNDGISDGVVPLTSQLNGASTGGSPGGGGPVTNVIHSAGLLDLDFLGPFELGDSLMANYMVDLLNEAKSGVDFHY
jgi:hypothetical protein